MILIFLYQISVSFSRFGILLLIKSLCTIFTHLKFSSPSSTPVTWVFALLKPFYSSHELSLFLFILSPHSTEMGSPRNRTKTGAVGHSCLCGGLTARGHCTQPHMMETREVPLQGLWSAPRIGMGPEISSVDTSLGTEAVGSSVRFHQSSTELQGKSCAHCSVLPTMDGVFFTLH